MDSRGDKRNTKNKGNSNKEVKIIEKFEINNIYQRDCIELLKNIADESVDLIFADPPYNLQLKEDLYRPNQTKVAAVSDEWDKFESKEKYDEFSNLWLKECYRVLKKNGSFWVKGTHIS